MASKRGFMWTVLSAAILISLVLSGQARAANAADRLDRLEREIEEMKTHDETIRKMAELVDRLNPSIKIAIWGEHVSPYDSSAGDESDILVDTVEVYFKPEINEWASGYLELEYDDSDQDIEAEEARIIIKNTDAFPLYTELGKFEAIHFGSFETFMLEGSITEGLGELKEIGGMLGFEKAGFYANAVVYNGGFNEAGEQDNHIENFAGLAGYKQSFGGFSFDIGASYINNIADAGDLPDILNTTNNEVDSFVGGAGAHAILGWQGLTFIAEYITALDEFDDQEMLFEGDKAKPSAWNLELGYEFDVLERGATVAVAYQGTDEAANSLNPSEFLPESRYLAHFDIEVLRHVSWGLEYLRNTAYEADSGIDPAVADEDETVLRTELAIEF